MSPKPIDEKWQMVRLTLVSQGWEEVDIAVLREMFFLGASALDEAIAACGGPEEVALFGAAIEVEFDEFYLGCEDGVAVALAPHPTTQ